ncbi:hypothetical protein AGDE_01594 [Angomonas deanei]|uniref:Uncharacterized protein n=1 Tax=Angomonas deanei TaxID=59799 RepID=A0A7G2C072_9TRYP|nr:hypothetical protein AGDE_01594 [Angomonas deanei]CAD2212714.1 hypothetical protein, conserved [Angomonas deanei]|eukprot:EPY42329.1 hypothetical protein AGDE_01594 [Angomonas deanei]
MMDPHRSVALDYLSRVTRADVILGNFLLPRNDGLEGYEDAFKLCGSPPQHERTINTFRRHAFDKLTNYYYFVPSPGLKKHRKNGKSGNGEQKETVTLADTKDVNSVGTPLPLSATRTAEGVWVDTKEEATILSPEAPAGGNAATSLERSEKWIYDHLADLSNQYNRDLAVPQVAGRFQRCYFRNNFKSSRTHSNQYSPFLLRYNKRCRTVVPKPFVQVELGENEARWQASNNVKGTNDGEAEEPVSHESVSCSLSDQYPVFVQLL